MSKEKHYNLYLAGPLFDSLDIKELEIIEKLCDKLEITYFSPRLHSQLDFKNAEDKDKIATKIVEMNEEAILQCDMVIANTRGLRGSFADSGTMYEIGYAVAKNIPVMTYTFNGYGLNIMISQRSVYHFAKINHNNTEELKYVLSAIFKSPFYNKIKRAFKNRESVSTKYKYKRMRDQLFDKGILSNIEMY